MNPASKYVGQVFELSSVYVFSDFYLYQYFELRETGPV